MAMDSQVAQNSSNSSGNHLSPPSSQRLACRNLRQESSPGVFSRRLSSCASDPHSSGEEYNRLNRVSEVVCDPRDATAGRALGADDEMLMFSVDTLPELRDIASSRISPPSFPGKLARYSVRRLGWRAESAGRTYEAVWMGGQLWRLSYTRSVNTGRVQREKASIKCREG